jgi:small subunit ribosomal protein S16
MKRMGRKNRPFYRVVAVDSRSARDGRVIEYLGHYDPMVPETDARAILNGTRIDYWLSVGALPSDKVGVLIKKYGTNGTHLAQQKAAIEQGKARRFQPPPPATRQQPKSESSSSQQGAEAAPESGAQLEPAAQES